jgi:hypothetical protein
LPATEYWVDLRAYEARSGETPRLLMCTTVTATSREMAFGFANGARAGLFGVVSQFQQGVIKFRPDA